MRIDVYIPSGIRIRYPSVQNLEDCSVYWCNARYRQCRTTKHKIKTAVFLDVSLFSVVVNPLTPNDPYRGRTAPLTSKRCILYIYSTNIGTEYFKHGIYCPFFSSSKCSLFHNSNIFGSCIIHILYTECAKRSILYIYSTNICTEYFKHGIYSRFFFLFKMQFIP